MNSAELNAIVNICSDPFDRLEVVRRFRDLVKDESGDGAPDQPSTSGPIAADDPWKRDAHHFALAKVLTGSEPTIANASGQPLKLSPLTPSIR